MDRPLPNSPDDQPSALPHARGSMLPAAPSRDSPAVTPVELPSLEFLGLFHIIARRKWIILLMLMAWISLAVLFIKHSPTIYESTGELEVESQDLQVRPYATIEKEDLRSIDALKTVERNIQSPSLIARMIENHGLASHLHGSLAAQVGHIQAHSSIALVKGTRNVRIRYRSQEPEFARRVVDAYIDEYQKMEQEDKKRLEASFKKGLAEREALFKKQLDDATAALDAFIDQHAPLDLRSDGNVVSDKLSDLMQRAADAEADRIELEKQLGSAASSPNPADLLQLSSITQRPEIQSLQSILHEKEAAFEALKKQRGPLHPEYIEAANELKAFKANLESAARNALDILKRDFQSARETEETFNDELAIQKDELFQREHVMTQYQKLQSHVDELQKILDDVTTGIYQSEVNSGLDSHIISVRERPMVSEAPVWPNKPFILAGGLTAGLICGLALAFSLETLRKTVRDETDVEKLLPGVNCLAVLPHSRMRTAQDRLVLAQDPHSFAAEGFRSLRTALYFQRDGEPQIIVITSAGAGAGKSYCAMNCAAAYAMQGYQTLLIDGDLRCPSLEETFLPGRNRGMTDLLRGRAEPQDICYPTQIDGLYFIPSGDLRPNPSELLAGPGLTALLLQASEFFDKIVIDSAPLAPVSDGFILARHAQATCLVVRSNTTKKRDLVYVRQKLAKTGLPLTGYILNGASGGRSDSSYVNYISQQRRNLKTNRDASPSLPIRYHELSEKAALL